MDSLTCVWKKSVSQDYGVISIQSIDGCTIEWLRCMTCKEALKKVETGGNIPVAVIEDSREKDIDLISDMIRAGVKVILLGGSQVVAGAISMATLGELSEWLERFIKGGLDITQNEVNKELEEPIEASDTPLVDMVDSEVDYSKYEAMIAERNRFKNLYMNTKDELDQLKQTLEGLMVDEEVVEYIGSGVDGKELQHKLDVANAEIDRLNKRVTELGVNRSEHRTVELQLEKADTEIAKLKLIHQTDIEALDTLRQAIIQISYYGREVVDKLHEANDRVKVSKEDVIGAEDRLAKANGIIEEREKKIQELENHITKITEDLEDVRESNEELSLDIIQSEKEKDSLRAELTSTRDKLNAEIEKEKSNLDELSDTAKELAELRAYDIDAMVNQIQQDKEMLAQYNKALAELQLEKDALRSENADLRQKVDNYNIMASKAHNKMIAHDRLSNGDFGSIVSIDPLSKGKATLAAVFGSGGHGTTAVATAIAEWLVTKSYDVAIVDMDFRSPKVDTVYRINPFIENLRGEIYSEASRTAVTALIKLGAQRWSDLFNSMGKVVNQNRKSGEGVLAYYSGVYDNSTGTEIAAADYETLLRKLGIEYDYIVLDMGRLESNGAIANLQAGVANCANNNFIVSNDKFEDVRSLNVRALNSRLKMTNTCWVLNMSDGKIPANTMQIVSSAAGNVEIPFIRDMYGTNFSLAENRKTAGSIEVLCAYMS